MKTTEHTDHTEMKADRIMAGQNHNFTEAHEDNKERRSFSDSFVSFVSFCSNSHPCIPSNPWLNSAFRVFSVFRGSPSGSVPLRASVVQEFRCPLTSDL